MMYLVWEDKGQDIDGILRVPMGCALIKLDLSSSVTILLPELIEELIQDSLKDSGWEQMITVPYELNDFQFLNLNALDKIKKIFLFQDLAIGCTDEKIEFFGDFTKLIDPNVELTTNEDILVEFLDWIYEGATLETFPLKERRELLSN